MRSDMPAVARPGTPAKLSIRTLLREMGGTYSGARTGLWGAAAVLFLGLSGALYLDLTQRSGGHIGLTIAGGVLRFTISVLAMIALYRLLLAPDRRPWRLDASTLAFAGGTGGILSAIAGTLLLARLWVAVIVQDMDPNTAALVRAVVLTVVSVLISLLFLRTQPWLASLAIGRRDLNLVAAWNATAGMNWVLVGTWLLLIPPLMLLHALVSLAGRGSQMAAEAHIMLATVDGAIIAAIGLVTALLNATIYRCLVAGRTEGTPR